MEAQVQCGYCCEPLADNETLDEHIPHCEVLKARPIYLPRIGFERERRDTPPHAA